MILKSSFFSYKAKTWNDIISWVASDLTFDDGLGPMLPIHTSQNSWFSNLLESILVVCSFFFFCNKASHTQFPPIFLIISLGNIFISRKAVTIFKRYICYPDIFMRGSF